ncbi:MULTISPECIES: alpha/beta hydrolase [unclassified Bacillus (in: firmicutes)]|uniref:alpha/beta hydrolase n=1 Tax=unclassified Bacillus (in: firmicutes) TaxID=185979 RepID=UPI001BEB80A5|nr:MULTISPECIES: alpha/beta hydrolase [unclassified Bacillus (in: firmicutes)]MBT2617254.1 alpha/beta hydrolase [Bacillus sp. ISL-78]MBT2627811.1 alpha/beta hydrolase [Bacillus sp. ISL-101]
MENKVNRELKQVLAYLPVLIISNESIVAVRQGMKEMALQNAPASNELISMTERFIPGPAGDPEVRVKIYQSVQKSGSDAGLLWIHGGGYVIGTPEMDDFLCQRYVLEANCTVVSVDYRLAPEHPFPAPVEDCYAALKWFSDHADELGVDRSRIAIAGASAGGGLTAATSLLARDRQGPPLVFQMPLYPMIDDRHITPSSTEVQDTRVWNEQSNRNAWAMYLGEQTEEVSPYAAPARALDLTCLPPTYTCVGDLDPFRDETIDYVTKLTKAGVPTEFHLYPGCFHGFEGYAPHTEIGKRAINQYIEALKYVFEKELVKNRSF